VCSVDSSTSAGSHVCSVDSSTSARRRVHLGALSLGRWRRRFPRQRFSGPLSSSFLWETKLHCIHNQFTAVPLILFFWLIWVGIQAWRLYALIYSTAARVVKLLL
jgi:hypothetical protein